MTEKKGAANIFEVVYTAANKLLAGGNGLGIVAATKSMPNDFEKTLSVLRSYTLPQLLKNKLSGKIGERFIFMPIKYVGISYLTFSRLSDSTSPPYLSRTTIIAHHLAIIVNDLANVKMDAADLVAWAGGLQGYDSKFDFIKGWDADPKSLEPLKFCKNAKLTAEALLKELGIENNLQSKMKDALAGVANRLFDFEETKKTAILIIPYDWQKYVPRLLAIILYLLPNGIQNSLLAVSQVWDKEDLNFNAGLVFTYPNAPYLETMKLSHIKNKVEVFDLTNLASVTGTFTAEATDKNYKQYALEYWDAKKPEGLNLLQIFNDLDPTCVGKKAVLALKGSIDDFLVKDSAENLTIAEKLEDVIKKLKVFYADSKNVIMYLKSFVDHAVKKATDFKNCDELLKIWKHVGLIDLKSDEMEKVLKTTFVAISDNYEDILEHSLPALAKACISPNRNLKIIEIVKKKSGALDSLLEAIETAVSNKRGEYIEKVLPVVVSNWFDKLGTKIIMSAWDRINEGGGGEDHPCYFSIIIINKLILSSGTNSTIAIGKNNQQESLENSDSKSPLKIKNLDPDGLRTEAFNELKKAFTALNGKDRILENLKIFVEKLKVFENTDLRKGILKEQFDKSVKKLIENKQRCEALFEIWDLIEENTSELNEIDDALKVPLKAISDNYNDILKQALPALAKACINANRNRKIIEIVKDKGYVPDPLLNAIEKEFLNRPKEIEEPSSDVVSNWFNLGPKIIFPAWDRIKIGVRENNLCGFSKAIVNLLVQNNYGLQIEHIDDDQQT